MKKILLLTAAIMILPACANAHSQRIHAKQHNIATHQTVTYHWIYISAMSINGRWVSGHWQKVAGPHPYANHADWRFVSGHHTKRSGHRVWVHGHWAQPLNKPKKANKRTR
jgi:uncharacterized GH25 family protein